MSTHHYCYQFHYKHGFKKNWIVSIHWVISPSPKLYCLWAVEWLKVSFWIFFNITLTVFENFFAAWYDKMFQDYLAHLLCKIQNQPFLQRARFFLVSTAWIHKESSSLSASYVTCPALLILSRLPWSG